MNEDHKRTIARAVSYRIVAMVVTSIIVGIENAIFIHILLTGIHYIHERIWLKIKWGRIENVHRRDI